MKPFRTRDELSFMFQRLKGHSSAVTHIIVNSDKGEIISAAQDKVSFFLKVDEVVNHIR